MRTECGCELHDGLPRDAGQAVVGVRRQQAAVLDHEDIRGIGLGHEPVQIQHDGVLCTRLVRLDLGQDVVDLPGENRWRRKARSAHGEAFPSGRWLY